MTPARFSRLLLEEGADIARWPEVERDGARALLAASPECRRRWAEARRLEELLALHWTRLEARGRAEGREAAIIEAALRRVRALPRRAPERRWLLSRPVGAALAAAVLAGLLVGWAMAPVLHPPRSAPATAIEALLEEPPVDTEELP